MEKIIDEFGVKPRFVGTFFGHQLKSIEGRMTSHPDFSHEKVYDLFGYVHRMKLDMEITKALIPIVFEHPNMAFESLLISIKFRKRSREELLAPMDYLLEKFKEINRSKNEDAVVNWVMGQLRTQATGNLSYRELRREIEIKLNDNIQNNR